MSIRSLLGLAFVALTACASTTTSPPTTNEPTAMSTKRILIVVTSHDHKGDKPSGFWLAEATHPHHVLAAAGYTIDFASPKGGAAPVDPESLDLKDPVNAAFWADPALRTAIDHTLSPAQVDPTKYDAIFYAGGHGAMWDFPDDSALATIASRIYDQGGVVAAVCHGPAALVNIKRADGSYLVAGKDVAAFTDEEERAANLDRVVPFLLASKLVERGAHHQAAPLWQPKVVVSERLVTGQNPASATAVGQAIVETLQRR